MAETRRAGAVASWRPLCPGLTPHGLRHGHQTCLDDIGIRYVPQSERMRHEVPGMRGVYNHITPGMREDLVAGLQQLWEASLQERARISARSPVRVLDALLAGSREPTNKIGSRVGSQNRTPERREARPSSGPGLLTCGFSGVSEGTRTPDTQDHNLVL